MRDSNNRRSIQRAAALAYARLYCAQHGLSFERLRGQRFDCLGDVAVFAQPSEVVPDGLKNDLDTMPKPTLVLRWQDGQMVILPTEYTEQYLKEQDPLIPPNKHRNFDTKRIRIAVLSFVRPVSARSKG